MALRRERAGARVTEIAGTEELRWPGTEREDAEVAEGAGVAGGS